MCPFKTPPHSIDAEMAVLGAMLIDKDSIGMAKEALSSEAFYSEKNKKIFETICDLDFKDEPVEILTVSEHLKNNKNLEKVGGEKYLTDLIEKLSTPAHTRNYAKLVKDKHILRQIINIATSIVEKSYNNVDDVDKILDDGQEQMLQIAQKNIDHGFASTHDLRHEITAAMEKAYREKRNITGIATGFTRFDELTSGLQKSDLVILAARPSQGKTAMALNIAYNAAVEDGKTVAIFSLEMSWRSLYERLICGGANANMTNLRKGRFQAGIWTNITREISRISEASIHIDDTPGLDVLDIRTRARKLANQLNAKGKKLDLIIIDYIQLIKSRGRKESRQQEVTEISSLLKNLARTLDVPVLALSQLNRRSEDKGRVGGRPQLSDLRESGSLEQDADVVALIWRPDYYNKDNPELKNKATLVIAKQRNGPVGDVNLNFIPESTKFVNPALPGTEPLEDAPEEEMAF